MYSSLLVIKASDHTGKVDKKQGQTFRFKPLGKRPSETNLLGLNAYSVCSRNNRRTAPSLGAQQTKHTGC